MNLLNQRPNMLTTVAPEADKYREVVQVYDVDGQLQIVGDVIARKSVCYFS
mgnify:CR=1 FL=1